MPGSNPSADSVASSERGCYGTPSGSLLARNPNRVRHQRDRSWTCEGKAPAGQTAHSCLRPSELAFSLDRLTKRATRPLTEEE